MTLLRKKAEALSMKHIFVINPAAGDGKAATVFLPRLQKLFQSAGQTPEIYLTGGKEDALRFTRERCQKQDGEPLRFYSVGGDGTLNEVVNGAYGSKNVTVAPLAYGSGNDFFAHLRRKRSFPDGKDGEVVRSDLLWVNGRYCVNACNIGFDANVVYNVDRIKRLFPLKGHAAYFASVVYSVFQPLGNRFSYEIDGKVFSTRDCLLLCCCNGSQYGGGFLSAPLAEVADGKMDVCPVKKVSRFQILSLVKAYRDGKHILDPKMKRFVDYYQCKDLSIRSEKPFRYCLDGECYEADALTVKVVLGGMDFYILSQKEQHLLEGR